MYTSGIYGNNQSISAATSAVESAQFRLEEDASVIDTYSIDANFIDAFFIGFDVEAAQALTSTVHIEPHLCCPFLDGASMEAGFELCCTPLLK